MLDFIRRCLNIDPNKRMTCEEAIRHDWFKDLSIKKEKEFKHKLNK
jgi:serine/threonine protein kinase